MVGFRRRNDPFGPRKLQPGLEGCPLWDRDRFDLLWGWPYRFEAYTPAPKRKLGYYAMPLLWRDRVVGWANLSVEKGRLKSEFGYVESRAPYDRAFKRELEAELDRMRSFLSIGS